MTPYEELVELLREVGVLQLDDEWALRIQAFIEQHKSEEDSE